MREDSRIKVKMSGFKADVKTLLLAYIADQTAIDNYAKTKDAKTGRNRPKSFFKALSEEKKQVKQFETGEDFMKEWARINGN